MLFAFYFSYISRNRMRCMQRSWLKLIGKQLDRIDLLLIGGNLHQNTQLYELNVDLTVRWSKLIQFNFLNHILIAFFRAYDKDNCEISNIWYVIYTRIYICRRLQEPTHYLPINWWNCLYKQLNNVFESDMRQRCNNGYSEEQRPRRMLFLCHFPPSHPRFLSDHALNKQNMPWQMDPNICN